MRLGSGAVDALRSGRSRLYERFKHRLPNAILRPSVEPIVDRGVRPIHLWAVAPTAADLQNMYNTADYFAIALRFHAAPVHRDQRFQNRPLPLVQPEFVGQFVRSYQSRSLNLTSPRRGKKIIGFRA